MKYSIAFIALLIQLYAKAQNIKGIIQDGVNNQPLIGATIHWMNTQTGTVSDQNGRFELLLPPNLPHSLVVSYIGYLNDTIIVNAQKEISIFLKPSVSLNEIVVSETKQSTTFSTIDPMNIQSLSAKELTKAACCNLAESFETNATVDVSYSDAVSGSKQIKVLGLDGSYTQILHEQMPGIRGLSTISGYSHIPGTWVKSIDITKGVGSVVNGYESISGQINIDLLRPEKTDRLFVNVYAGDAGRYESNVHLGHRFNKKWSSLLLMHGSGVINKNDFNKDGFIDVPLSSQFNVMNKWKYENPGKLMSMFGFQALVDNRQGGQINFAHKEDNDAQKVYGININIKHIEAFTKTAIGFAGQPYKSLGIMINTRAFDQDAYYGFKSYKGQEQTATINLTYQSIINTSDHKIKIGSSYMLDNYHELYQDSAFKRTESVPGIFSEYNYDVPNKASILAGVRVDYHNLFGPMVNPRIHLKYHIRPLTVIRLSGGRGMRVANIFIENASTMASSRQVIIAEKLNPEVAWNYGASITHKFKVFHKSTVLNVDFYRTDFQNQVIADLDANPQQIIFYNLKGQSYSNSFQAEVNYEPIHHFELRLAYKWQDVKTTYHGELLEKPLIAQNRILFNMAYATKFDKWKFDFTTKWFGRNRIPNTSSNPDGMRFNNYSVPYYVFNAQITRAFKQFEIYIGAENIFDYVQSNQIIDKDNPFGKHFDTSLIWGPVMGRVIYMGLRFTIK